MQKADLKVNITGTRLRKRLGQVPTERMSAPKEGGTGPVHMKKSLAASQRRSTEYFAYVLFVQYGEIKWTVERRYSQFDSLDHHLHELYPDLMASIKLPARLRVTPPTVPSDEMDKRRFGLEEYLGQILANEDMNRSFVVLKFLMLENPKRSPVTLHVTREGMLIKRGDFIDEMRARQFALYDHIFFYKDKLDVVPSGVINLKTPGIEIQEEPSEKGREEFPFSIMVPGKKRKFLLKAESKKSRKEWIGAIRAILDDEPPKEKLAYTPHGITEEADEDEHPELEASLVAAYRSIFKELDQDGSGAISMNELIIALADAGWEFKGLVVKDLLKMVDYDGTGALDVDEFIDLISMLTYLQGAFDVLDEDKSGAIEPKELPEVLRSAEFSFDSQDQVDALFALCDHDKSGAVEFEEYLHLVFFLKYLTKLFREFDADGTGELDKTNLPKLLDKMELEVAPDVHDRVMNLVDKAKTSSLSFEEIVHYVFEVKFGGVAEEVKAHAAKIHDQQLKLVEDRVSKRRTTMTQREEEKRKAQQAVKKAEEKEREEQIQHRNALIKKWQGGVEMIEYTNKKKGAKVRVFIDDKAEKLCYKDKKNFLLIKDIRNLVLGRETDVFRKRGLAPDKVPMSFSFVTAQNASLDVECKTTEERDANVAEWKTILGKDVKKKSKVAPAKLDEIELSTPDQVIVPTLSDDLAAKARTVLDSMADETGKAKAKLCGEMLKSYSDGKWVFSDITVTDLVHSAGLELTQMMAPSDFEELVKKVSFWAKIFADHDKKKQGFFPVLDDLRLALRDAGCELEEYQMETVILKPQATPGKGKAEGVADLDDFVGICAFMYYIWTIFKRQAGGSNKISRGQFRGIVPMVGEDVSDELIKVVTNDMMKHGEENLFYNHVVEFLFAIHFAPKL